MNGTEMGPSRVARAPGTRLRRMAVATLKPSWRWRLPLLVGAIVASVFTGVGGAASTANPVCGQTVTESIVLTADLKCSGTGLRVEGQNITIDLNGHTISGSGVGVGIAAPPALAPSTTILNGRIRHFGVGVTFNFGIYDFLVLRHLTITQNGWGIEINTASAGQPGDILIEDSVISRNEGPGYPRRKASSFASFGTRSRITEEKASIPTTRQMVPSMRAISWHETAGSASQSNEAPRGSSATRSSETGSQQIAVAPMESGCWRVRRPSTAGT